MEIKTDYHVYLSKTNATSEVADLEKIFQVPQIEVLLVSADIIRQACQRDGWPQSSEKELEPFHRRKDELTLQDSCLMWDSQ